MSPARPSSAAAAKTQSGCTRINKAMHAVASVIAAATQLKSAMLAITVAITVALAAVSPIVTGMRPQLSAPCQAAPVKRYEAWPTAKASSEVGPHIASVAATAPAIPATW